MRSGLKGGQILEIKTMIKFQKEDYLKISNWLRNLD